MSPLSRPSFCYGSPCTATFREITGRTNSPGLVHSFRNPLRLIWVCHLPRSRTPTYPGSMKSLAPPLDSPGPWWIEAVPTNYLDLVVTSSQPWLLRGHSVMGTNAERMRLPFNDFCQGCRSAEEEDIFVHFLCQCPSLSSCRYRLFDSSFLVSLMELSFIDINEIVTFIKLSSWFSSRTFDWQPTDLTNFFIFDCFGRTWLVQGKRLTCATRAQVSFVISELPLRPKPKPTLI